MMSGKNSSCVRVFIFSSSSSVLCFYKHRDSGGDAACVHIVYSCITVVSSLLFIFNFSKNKKVCDLKPTSVPIQISPNVSLNISSLYHHLRLIEAGFFLLSDFQCPNMRCSASLCCVLFSRLQGDTLSDSRSEEEHRPHISEQAVPDISCKLQFILNI